MYWPVEKMSALLREADQIRHREGHRSLIIRSIGYIYRGSIRQILPVQGSAVWNGVEMPDQVSNTKRLFDNYLPTSFHYSIQPDAEGGECKAHRKYTELGDRVVIIGGGRGVSSVVAAQQVGSSGSVDIFEGSVEFAEIVRTTCKKNNVYERCTVHNEIIGPRKNVYGKGKKKTTPDNLPECDVLEMDCEGAEKEILEMIDIRPRNLIVEVHPINFKNDPIYVVTNTIESLGYDIVSFMSNDGKKVGRETFNDLLVDNRENNDPSPVLVAERIEQATD